MTGNPHRHGTPPTLGQRLPSADGKGKAAGASGYIFRIPPAPAERRRPEVGRPARKHRLRCLGRVSLMLLTTPGPTAKINASLLWLLRHGCPSQSALPQRRLPLPASKPSLGESPAAVTEGGGSYEKQFRPVGLPRCYISTSFKTFPPPQISPTVTWAPICGTPRYGGGGKRQREG